ncbi:response regulator transcription factor [Sphingobium sufflavum]|jgi:DNA-binding NarL/FixJ family response regulator|uniref:response regulator transcription factor n=1 Tax=Sphingobium sufflavum TaxID=1129547 RepID=UPI001F27D81A|nr:response regulator transcription factor [Sphingobium sufflavum]MCE7796647.1 response regulator transcription factor [Sphingobium sufflavum]
MAQLRILLADDHPLVREGLAMAIRSRHPDIILDFADSIAAAEVLARTHQGYALMLLDYRLPDADGFSGLFRMQHALGHTPIAVVSAYDEPQIVTAARAIGAAGFLSKSQPFDALAQSIDELLHGRTVFPPVSEDVPGLSDLRDRLKSLTTAQMRVLTALVKGHLNKQIAGDLDLSEATVKAHMTAIFRKLGVSNRVQAVLAVGPLFDLQS